MNSGTCYVNPDDQKWWDSTVKRTQPYRVLNISIGDIIVVPLWHGFFSIFEVTDKLLKISNKESFDTYVDFSAAVFKQIVKYKGEKNTAHKQSG